MQKSDARPENSVLASNRGVYPPRCAWCDEPFTRTPSRLRHCSARCELMAAQAYTRPTAHEYHEEHRCEQCGRPFRPTRAEQVYCSYACRDWVGETRRMVDAGWQHFWSRPGRSEPSSDATVHCGQDDLAAAMTGNAFAGIGAKPMQQQQEVE